MEVASSADPTPGLVDPEVPQLNLERDWETFARARGLSEATAARWHPVLRSFEKHLGSSDLSTSTPEDVQSWLLSLFESGTSKRTATGVYLPAITNFLAWASSENRIDKSPF